MGRVGAKVSYDVARDTLIGYANAQFLLSVASRLIRAGLRIARDQSREWR